MKILYLHQYFATPDGHWGTRSYEFARRLVGNGHSVTVITSTAALGDSAQRGDYRITVDGIEVMALDVQYQQSMSMMRRKFAFAEFAVRSANTARKLPADIVLATSTPLTIAIPGVIAARQKKVPLVLEVRDLWPEIPIAMGALQNPLSRLSARQLERWAYRSARHIIALSPGIARGIVRAGVPESVVSMIPNSCDIELFSTAPSSREETRELLGLAPSDVLVLYAGSFGRANRVDYLVRVAKESRTITNVLHFLLVGSGSEYDHVAHVAQQEGVLGENLKVLPAVPKRELVHLFGAADIVASVFAPIPELLDNSANKFFDGLAAGKAIAINYGGWQADILRETGAGIVLASNAQQAARQLSDFSSDRHSLEAAGAAALHLAKSRFSRDTHALQLEEILNEQSRAAHSASQPPKP